jgi:hypothetical protein
MVIMGCGCNKNKGNRNRIAESNQRKTAQNNSSSPKTTRQSIRDLWNKTADTEKKTTVKRINKLPKRK